MAGGVRLLILNKKSKMINMLRKGIKFSMQRCISAKLFLM